MSDLSIVTMLCHRRISCAPQPQSVSPYVKQRLAEIGKQWFLSKSDQVAVS